MTTFVAEWTAALANLQPPINAEFGKPASRDAIANAEARLGTAFNDDLRAFLLAADGQQFADDAFLGDPVIPKLRFGPQAEHFSAWGWLLGVDGIVECTLAYREDAEETEQFGDEHDRYEIHGPAGIHHDHLVISRCDDPVILAIDNRPAAGGVCGQIVTINQQPNHLAVVASSFSEFLRVVLDGYRTGRFRLQADGTWS